MTNEIFKGFDHFDIRVKDLKKSYSFYNKLLKYFGFKQVTDEKDYKGWSNGPNGFWIEQVTEKHIGKNFHRKQIGVNHIAFRAKSRKAIDDFYKNFLLKEKILVLYGGPKEYPEYHKGYYAVFFEDPDRIKLELMWMNESK